MLSKFLWKEGEFKSEMKFLFFANMASSMHSCTQVLGDSDGASLLHSIKIYCTGRFRC